MVEHVFGGFAEVDDPLAERRRLDAKGHVLRVAGAGGVVVAADAADAAGDEVGVARVLALHEDAVAAEDRRRAVALGDLAFAEVDLGEDAQAADDPGDRIPAHFDQVAAFVRLRVLGSTVVAMVGSLCFDGRMRFGRLSVLVRQRTRQPLVEAHGGRISGRQCGPAMAPFGFFVDCVIRYPSQRVDARRPRVEDIVETAGSRGLIHEGHEFVGKAGHRAADADAADVGASADAGHPAAFRHVAVDDRPPATELHQAFGRAVLVGELPLFVIAAAVAAFVDRVLKEPFGPELIVERDHRCQARRPGTADRAASP